MQVRHLAALPPGTLKTSIPQTPGTATLQTARSTGCNSPGCNAATLSDCNSTDCYSARFSANVGPSLLVGSASVSFGCKISSATCGFEDDCWTSATIEAGRRAEGLLRKECKSGIVPTAVGTFKFLALKTDEADIRAVVFSDIHRTATEEAEGSCGHDTVRGNRCSYRLFVE